MRRGENGGYRTMNVGDELVRTCVPAPLPPVPPLVLGGPLQRALESAAVAVGGLGAVSPLLPDPELFLYTYVRKEAVFSSQIEGTQSSLSDLLLYELEETPGVPFDDVVEVSNYVAALEHGLRRLADGFPLCNRLIREIHGVLLSHGRGSDKAPGEFRTSQNWIGGSRPGNAAFVPPPHTEVPECMAAFERFLHADGDELPTLVRAGLAHVQFETIHPFLDGNGRIGRLLTTLQLYQAGLLPEPLLYLSLYFKQHRSTYYDLLMHVRGTGDWEAWLAFFLEGVRETAENAVATARRLSETFESDRAWIQRQGRRAGSALRVHAAFMRRPLLSPSRICRRTRLSTTTVAAVLQLLLEHRMVREITGKKRGRVFAYDRYLSILNEGAEPP